MHPFIIATIMMSCLKNTAQGFDTWISLIPYCIRIIHKNLIYHIFLKMPFFWNSIITKPTQSVSYAKVLSIQTFLMTKINISYLN